MGRTERSAGEAGLAGGEVAGDGVELGGFQGFVEGEGREDGGQPLGQHGLPRARRPHQEDVVVETPAHSGYSPWPGE
jgi:hypothetical protein